jgi:serine/threonine protein kinase
VLNTILRGHYKIISHLGGGGFGQTYLAEDIDLPTHPTCVVKQLKPLSKRLFENVGIPRESRQGIIK